ncbi:MAG: ATP-binding protein [Desulfobacterales bacterium]
MTHLERLITHSPWWDESDWARNDRSLKRVRSANFSFRHLSQELRRPENLPPGSISIKRGPRQVGKTTELKLLVNDLLSAGIPPRNIAYYPCDDIIHFRELTELIRTFAETIKMIDGCGYLMLDEITAVKDWSRAVKSLVDAGVLENIYLLLTGSSAIEIKRGYERMPGRRGYGFDRAFLPMSFTDFCRAYDLKPPLAALTDILSDKDSFRMYEMETAGEKNKFEEILKNYMEWGGFPMVVADLINTGSVAEQTMDIYRSVLLSEFEKQRRKVSLILSLMRKLYNVLGTPVSYNSLTQDTGCRSNAVVQDYLEIINAAFLGFILPCIDLTHRRPYPKREKKFYAVDPIIWKIAAAGAGLPPIHDAVLAEHVVANHLIRPLANTWADLGSLEGLYYYRSRKGREVDFVYFITHTGRPFGVEVKFQSRVSGWDEQSISKGIGQGVLITRDSFRWNKICHIPVWAFLLLKVTNS